MSLGPEITEVVCPGFGIHPDILQRPQWLWVPFPGQFLQALGRLDFEDNTVPIPFTNEWEKFWLELSTAASPNSRKCRRFFESDGYKALQQIESKGCDANLVMSLFAQYLWDEGIPPSESKDPNVIANREDLAAVKRTLQLFRFYTQEITPETRLVDATLVQLQSIVQAIAGSADFRPGRHPQNDKQNRVIYALSSHLKQAAKSPNWSLLLRLLVGAGAISANESINLQSDRAARRIVPRLQVFKKEHPKEAKLIPAFVATWSISSRDSRIAERTRILSLLPPGSK